MWLYAIIHRSDGDDATFASSCRDAQVTMTAAESGDPLFACSSIEQQLAKFGIKDCSLPVQWSSGIPFYKRWVSNNEASSRSQSAESSNLFITARLLERIGQIVDTQGSIPS